MPYNSGLYTGLIYSAYPIVTNTPASQVQTIDNWINSVIRDNKIDSIVAIFMMPTAFVSGVDSGYIVPKYNTYTVERTDVVDTYIPRNKKLLTYPFKFLCVDTITDSHIYRYERSTQTSNNRKAIILKMICAMSPNPEIVCAPIGYNVGGAVDGGTLDPDMPNFTESVTVSGFPQCAFAVDSYKAWLAQQGGYVGAGVGALGSLATLGAGIATENPMLGIAGGVGLVNSIKNLLVQQTRGAKSRGVQGNGTMLGDRHLGAYLKSMSVNRQQARVIDSFFDRFGYACERIKVPNRNVRASWTYCKTRDCALHGNVPAEALEKIKSIYDNGITWWNKNVDIGNYSLSNGVLT